MKKHRIIVSFLLIIGTIVFPMLNGLNQVSADGWFDSYDSKISWNFERAYLHGFADYLQKEPDFVGYIAFYTGKKDKPSKIKSQVQRAKNFLVTKENIDPNRIIIVDAGKRYDNSVIVLQPVPAGNKPPNF